MFVSFNSNMTGTTSGAGTSYLSPETELLNINKRLIVKWCKINNVKGLGGSMS